MGVGIEGDVGEAQAIADEPVAALEVPVHQFQRGFPQLALHRQERALQGVELVFADEGDPEAHRRDVRLVIILLPEHPAQHVGALEAALGYERRSVGQEEAGGVAFGKENIAVLKHRDAAVGIDVRQEFRRARLALHHVIAAKLQRQAEVGGGQPDLVAIARARILVEDHEPTSSTILPTCSPDSMRAWAAAASASGKTLSMTGFSRLPSA